MQCKYNYFNFYVIRFFQFIAHKFGTHNPILNQNKAHSSDENKLEQESDTNIFEFKFLEVKYFILNIRFLLFCKYFFNIDYK